MNTNIGIADKNRKAVTVELTKLLADEFLLYTKTRNAHWNIDGKDFHSVHIFFESQYEQLEKSWTTWPSASGNWDITHPRR